MRGVPLSELKPGTVLTAAVHSPRGPVLLQSNVVLTERHIDLMQRHGLGVVAAAPPERAGMPPTFVDPLVRNRAVEILHDVHLDLEELLAPLRALAPAEAAIYLRSGHLLGRLVASGRRAALTRALQVAADTLLAGDVRRGAAVDRPAPPDTVVHAVDTTVVALEVGRRLNLPPADLRQLVDACLLQDVGLLAVPDGVPERHALRSDGSDWMRLHPLVGYELVRSLRPGDLVASHVAYQHHERQDGAGYPRGLRGANRVGRARTDPPSSQGRILLEAEIAAVADVYVTLNARRPGRRSLDAHEVAGALRLLSGPHLNREVVGALTGLLGDVACPTGVPS
jgi:hypothetical protein